MSRGGDPVQQDDTERLPIVLELIAMTTTVATSAVSELIAMREAVATPSIVTNSHDGDGGNVGTHNKKNNDMEDFKK